MTEIDPQSAEATGRDLPATRQTGRAVAVVPRGGTAWRRRLQVSSAALAVAAVISLALEFGFSEPPMPLGLLIAVQIMAVCVYVATRVHLVWTAASKWPAIRSCWPDALLLVLASGIAFWGLELMPTPVLKVSAVYVAGMQILLVARLALGVVRLNLRVSQSRLHPTRVLALTFLLLIVAGALALALPKATTAALHDQASFSVWRHLLDCLFTATSATCVTGLLVYDTGRDFTLYGQIVILLLIQAGGLGIMIFGGIFGLLAGRQLSLKQSLVLQDALSYRTLGQMRRMIVFIVLSTFLIEAVGAIALYPMWRDVGAPGMRVFYSIFHAVSAFCNAGFALRADSLAAYQRAWQVYLVVVPLILVGGLGFPVLSNLWQVGGAKLMRRLRGAASSAPRNNGRRHRLSLHTKLVLTVSATLIVLPTMAFFVFESFASTNAPSGDSSTAAVMASSSLGGRLLDSFFLSVTCRTAGFNTVALEEGAISPATHFLAGALMLIGGSPASTAGGIKTVGLAVLFLGVWTTLRGRDRVEAFGRTIPDTLVRRAAVVVILMSVLVMLVTLILCFYEQASLRAAWFEAVSACGTVGLSTGLTPKLTIVGRVVIMVAMFAGRLGPLTVLIALAGKSPTSRYEYPSEQVLIG